MTSGVLFPFLCLATLGALVALDERGLFGGVVRTPVLVGVLAGSLCGHTALGLSVGLVFALLWPAPFRSGGHRAMSPGLAVLVGAGAVSLAAAGTAGGGDGVRENTIVGSSVAQILASTGNASVALAVLLGSIGAIVHQKSEILLRRRLGARLHADTPERLRVRAVREVIVLGLVLGLLAGCLGLLTGSLRLVERIASAGWDGGAWPWVLIASVLGAASQLGRMRGTRTGVLEWAVGVVLGLGGGLLIGGVW